MSFLIPTAGPAARRFTLDPHVSAGMSPELRDIVEEACQPDFHRWHEQAVRTGGCADPLHLTGGSQIVRPATGEVLQVFDTAGEPGGRLLIPCGNRRASRCRPCSARYHGDSYFVHYAALAGGKGVPETVREHPRVLATFTAPGFGGAHHHIVDSTGRPQPCHPYGHPRCGRQHDKDDPLLGQPLDPERYDYVGAVIWNAMCRLLWHATIKQIRVELAALAGISQRQFRQQCRLSYGKAAEYQLRCLLHFHAVLRLDGIDPDEPRRVIPPPEWASVDLLEQAIGNATAKVSLSSPACDATGGPVEVRWGEQLDIHPIAAFGTGEDITDRAVAGYIAKYATKGAECTGTVDRSLWCRACRATGIADPQTGVDCGKCDGSGTSQPLDNLKVPEHARRMILTCWELGGHPELEALRLRPWAHMLGFGGHIISKSRCYSTTLTALRNARRDYNMDNTLRHLGLDPTTTTVMRASPHRRPDQDNDTTIQLGDAWYDVHDPPEDLTKQDNDTVLVIGHWRYAGRGHSPGQALWAEGIAKDIADYRILAREAAREQQEDERRFWEALR